MTDTLTQGMTDKRTDTLTDTLVRLGIAQGYNCLWIEVSCVAFRVQYVGFSYSSQSGLGCSM
jgi:hypothetical protein